MAVTPAWREAPQWPPWAEQDTTPYGGEFGAAAESANQSEVDVNGQTLMVNAPQVPGGRTWKPILCRFYQKGVCAKGNMCPFVHGEADDMDSLYEEVHVEQRLVGWLLGKSGVILKEMQQATGAKLTVNQGNPDGHSIVQIFGGSMQREAAKTVLQDHLDREGKVASKGKGKGKDKGKRRQMEEEMSEDPVTVAVLLGLTPIQHLEQEWEFDKLVKRVCHYIQTASKDVDLSEASGWESMINCMADGIFCALFQALGNRTWLQEADWLLVFDAVVQANMPKEVLENVSSDEVESAVLRAHDRAVEEQRYLPLLWDACKVDMEVPKMQKKVYDAAEQARRIAVDEPTVGTAEDFISLWIETTIRQMALEMKGLPRQVMSQGMAARLFHSLVENDCVPKYLREKARAANLIPSDGYWRLIADAVEEAYMIHDRADKKRTWLDGPGSCGAYGIPEKPGEWNCPFCGMLNYAKSWSCFGCSAVPPARSDHDRWRVAPY